MDVLYRKKQINYIWVKYKCLCIWQKGGSMNPALIIIVVILCVAVWFLSSKLFKPIGTFILNVLDMLKGEDESEKESED